jgi:hypothetical protein
MPMDWEWESGHPESETGALSHPTDPIYNAAGCFGLRATVCKPQLYPTCSLLQAILKPVICFRSYKREENTSVQCKTLPIPVSQSVEQWTAWVLFLAGAWLLYSQSLRALGDKTAGTWKHDHLRLGLRWGPIMYGNWLVRSRPTFLRCVLPP